MDHASAVSAFREGEMVDEKYRIERTLHVGSMAVVASARHLLLDELVVLKFLLPEAAGQTETVVRFVREARAAARIKSHHVVRVFDVVVPTGLPYIVMEYLHGSNMAEWLGCQGQLPFQEAVDFVLQVCEVIAEAHALGLVHRDLKPSNLFVVRRAGVTESVKVLDFGIVKGAARASPGDSNADGESTERWTILGSAFYMSPEQMESAHEVDARADIWAMGVILFELISGKVPYEGRSLVEIYSKIVSHAPPRLPPSLCCPPSLEHIISRCLAADRDARYRDVNELAGELAQFGSNWSVPSVERILRGFASQTASEIEPNVAPPTSASEAPSAVLFDWPSLANQTLVSSGIER